MKRYTNTILPVEIGMNLDDIESVKFKFVQNGRAPVFFEYPSSSVFRKSGTNVLLLRWSKELTGYFSSEYKVSMDTNIELKESDKNPTTQILNFMISPTLFTYEEVHTDA